ncbi:glucan biosynthesis protein G [Solidesulfovibrio sp.]|uniref:glucan biosynthesis protein G n=1 Tax=Solidesulfovibrio sp. TaxID=2910990 RepID=UPI0026197DDD|nr:glucan biosynthesis protein G [Solidesulfovibrio sp.]
MLSKASMPPWRSISLGLAILPLVLLLVQPVRAEEAFSFEKLTAMARQLAVTPYQAPGQIPKPLGGISYDTWRKIRFKPEAALWRKENLPFELQFFPPGFLYDRTVTVNIVSGGMASPLALGTDSFDLSQVEDLAQQLPSRIGIAGFRVHTAINTPTYLDEFLLFLGASYFRAVSRGENYGLSARGLAVNTASPSGEEFPWFREFWIVKPAKTDKAIRIFALLDSQNLTGAYAFAATPGQETIIDVNARIFLRQPVAKLGIAPLTSMFFYGENSLPGTRQDWRPEVHDSDGLLVHFRNGEWLWRPLVNPVHLQGNLFTAGHVRGFGLLQRDTDFADYQDLEARMENRPSVWIEPQGNWGDGGVELVLIPSDKEIHDNVVVFFRPNTTPEPGKALEFAYRMRWGKAPDDLPPGPRVTATRTSVPNPDQRLFVVDFGGKALARLKPDAVVQGIVSAGSGGTILEHQVYRNPVTGGWRLTFTAALDKSGALAGVLPDKRPPVELRAFLKLPDGRVSETWSTSMTPVAP